MGKKETVRVEFDPPRIVEEVGKALKLTAEGEDDLWLPTTTTLLEYVGGTVEAATVPRFIAEDQGLIVVDCPQEENNNDSMAHAELWKWCKELVYHPPDSEEWGRAMDMIGEIITEARGDE